MAIDKQRKVMLNALMANKDLQSQIKMAMKSPIGSTKRKKAATLLRNMGAGGGIGMGAGLAMNGGMMMDGKGGAFDGGLGFDLSGGTGQTGNNIIPSGAQTSNNTQTSTPTMVTDPALVRQGSTYIFPAASARKSTGTAEPFDLGVNINTSTANSTPALYPEKKSEEAVDEIIAAQPATIEQEGETQEDVPVEDMTVDTLMQNMFNTNDPSLISEEESSDWQKLIQDAVAKGVGKTTFYNSVVNDDKKLSLLEQISGVASGTLPRGSIFAEQVDELSKSVREKMGLDQAYTQLQSIRDQGVDIDETLALSTTRDQLISRYQKMVEGTKAKLYDTTNIFERRSLKNYLSNLYIRLNSEEDRYASFISSGLKNYNNNLKIAEDNYKDLEKKIETEITRSTDISKEQYNTLKGMIEEAYTQAEKLAGDYLTNEQKKLTIQNSQLNIAKNTLDLQKTIEEMADGGKSNLKLTQTQEVNGLANFGKFGDGSQSEWDELPLEEKVVWSTFNSGSYINEWLGTDEAKNISDEEKASFIRAMGESPEKHGVYE